MDQWKAQNFINLEQFRTTVEGHLARHAEQLQKLNIEFDEELYPHLFSAIAERRWLIGHGLRLAALGTLESEEVKNAFGAVFRCALARGKAAAVEELCEQKVLEVSPTQVPERI